MCSLFNNNLPNAQLRNYAKNICAIISTFSFLNGSWVGGWERELGQQMSDTCGKKLTMELCWAALSENGPRKPEPQEQASSGPQHRPLVGQLNGGCAEASGSQGSLLPNPHFALSFRHTAGLPPWVDMEMNHSLLQQPWWWGRGVGKISLRWQRESGPLFYLLVHPEPDL